MPTLIEALPASPIAERLTNLIESVDELLTDAEDCDLTAAAHKLSEALGPLREARLAAYQYTAGVLPAPGTITPFDESCPECGSRRNEHCASGYGPTRGGAHYPRIERAVDRNGAAQERHRIDVERINELVCALDD